MKKFFKIIFPFSFILFLSCSQPIVLKNMISEQSGVFENKNSSNGNYFIDKNISEKIELILSNETHGSFSNSSFLGYNKFLFVPELSGRIYVFDRLNGKLIGYEKFNGEISVSPIINSFRLFIAVNRLEEKNFSVINFDLLNGKILTEEKIKGKIISEIHKVDDGFIVISNLGEVVKFNYAGSIVWKKKFDPISSNSTMHNDRLYFANKNYELICFDIHSQKIIYKKKFDDQISSGIIVNNNACFFGDEVGNIFSINRDGGKINWKFKTGGKIITYPVANDQFIFVGNLKGEIICIEKSSGKIIWKVATNGLINSSPILFKNILIQPDNNRKVYFIDVNNGKILNTISFERRVKSSPLYFDGIIYFGIDRGIINAYKINFN